MLPSFAARVLSRVYMPSGLLAGNHFTAIARQRVVARTFLTTAPAFEPRAAAKDKATADKKAPAKKRAPSATKGKSAEKRAAEKEKAAKAKEKEKERARKEREKERKKQRELKARERKKQRDLQAKERKAAQKDGLASRIKAPLRDLKIPKDQRPPKSPPNAYMVFISEYQAGVGLAGKTREEINKVFAEGAQKWNALDEEAKNEYRKKAEVFKKEYNERIQQWYTTAHPRIIKAAKLQKMRLGKVSEDLKRPVAPYIKFHQEHWDKLEAPVGVSMQEGIAIRGKKISEMWHAASQEERERYVDEYKKEVAEYQKREAEQAAAALAQSS
ncbi:hypothetical protein C8Q70DRAFT_459144 [Cubamyces menziesii]|nr:hypothetical protein C8Q70DRAFT_459144 [Cubamyces menziesii]